MLLGFQLFNRKSKKSNQWLNEWCCWLHPTGNTLSKWKCQSFAWISLGLCWRWKPLNLIMPCGNWHFLFRPQNVGRLLSFFRLHSTPILVAIIVKGPLLGPFSFCSLLAHMVGGVLARIIIFVCSKLELQNNKVFHCHHSFSAECDTWLKTETFKYVAEYIRLVQHWKIVNVIR